MMTTGMPYFMITIPEDPWNCPVDALFSRLGDAQPLKVKLKSCRGLGCHPCFENHFNPTGSFLITSLMYGHHGHLQRAPTGFDKKHREDSLAGSRATPVDVSSHSLKVNPGSCAEAVPPEYDATNRGISCIQLRTMPPLVACYFFIEAIFDQERLLLHTVPYTCYHYWALRSTIVHARL